MADLASQFNRAMLNLTEKMKKKEALEAAVIRAVEPLRHAAAASVSRKSGKLSESMTIQSMSFAREGEVIVRVGPGFPSGSHGILLEVGTIYMTARPFLGSAYAATQQEIAERMGRELSDLIL